MSMYPLFYYYFALSYEFFIFYVHNMLKYDCQSSIVEYSRKFI